MSREIKTPVMIMVTLEMRRQLIELAKKHSNGKVSWVGRKLLELGLKEYEKRGGFR